MSYLAQFAHTVPALSIDGKQQSDITDVTSLLCQDYLASPRPAECVTPSAYNIIDIEYVYSVRSDKDGDFIVSQLLNEFRQPIAPNNFYYYSVYPVGDIEFITDETGRYYCTSKDEICEISLIHVSRWQTLFCTTR